MITAEQREERRKSIGSSDAAAILNCDPFRNRADVYYEKIGETSDEPNESMEIGNRLEGVLLQLAEERFGAIDHDISLIDEEYSILHANLDGRASNSVVECKYVGPKGADFWGEPESDQVPDHVALQVQHQLRVSRLDRAQVVAAIVRPFVGLRFEFFRVARDDELIDALVTAELAFWRQHVEKRIPPANSVPSLDILKRLRREPGSAIELNGFAADAVLYWEQAKEIAKVSQNKADGAFADLLATLGDSEAGRLPDGRLLWYREENSGLRLIDSKAAWAAHPELFETTTRRVLRIKKGSK